MLMKVNEGKTDRLIRFVLGAVLLALYLANVLTGTWGTVALVVSIVLLATAATGFCGLYALLGINTCPIKKQEQQS